VIPKQTVGRDVVVRCKLCRKRQIRTRLSTFLFANWGANQVSTILSLPLEEIAKSYEFKCLLFVGRYIRRIWYIQMPYIGTLDSNHQFISYDPNFEYGVKADEELFCIWYPLLISELGEPISVLGTGTLPSFNSCSDAELPRRTFERYRHNVSRQITRGTGAVEESKVWWTLHCLGSHAYLRYALACEKQWSLLEFTQVWSNCVIRTVTVVSPSL